MFRCCIKPITSFPVAVEEELKWEWEKFIIRTNFETWKTKMINQFKEAKDYGIKK